MASFFPRAVNCDSLWRPWYIILITCLQAFLLYSGIAGYLDYKEHFFNPKYGGNWNPDPMNFYLAMLITALLLDCVFLNACFSNGSSLATECLPQGPKMMVTSWPIPASQSQAEGSSAGLYATAYGRGIQGAGRLVMGEEECLGDVAPFDTWSARSANQLPPNEFVAYPMIPPAMYRSMVSTSVANPDRKLGWPRVRRLWQRLQARCLPTSSWMHIVSAYAFFVALPVLDAQKILHHALPRENLWNCSLNLLPRTTSMNVMSAEMVNLIFAFAATALRYPATFWRTNHAFAFIFSLILTLLGAQALLELNSAEILVKLCWNNKTLGATLAGLCQTTHQAARRLDPIGPSGFEDLEDDPEGLRNAAPIFFSIAGTLAMLLLMATVFDYGLEYLVERLATIRKNTIFPQNPQAMPPSSDEASMHAGSAGVGTVGVCGLKLADSARRRMNILRRVIVVLGTLAVLGLKMPILLASGRLLVEVLETPQRALLSAHLFASVALFCLWFIVWFAFCLKPEWKIKISCSPSYMPQHQFPMPNNALATYLSHHGTQVRPPGANRRLSTSQMDGAAATGPRLLPTTNPVYACFHDGQLGVQQGPGIFRMGLPPQPNLPHGQGQSLQQQQTQQQNPPPSGDCCSVDTEESSRQSGTNNYVCLQSSLNNPNQLGMNALRGTPLNMSHSYANTGTAPSSRPPSTEPTPLIQSAPPVPVVTHDNGDSLGGLRYPLRPSGVFSPGSLRFMGSSPPFPPQGTVENDTGHILGSGGAPLNEVQPFLAASSISTKLQQSTEDAKPHLVNFNESKNSPNTGDPGSSSNPNSSSDSGINNHVPSIATPTPGQTNTFSTLPHAPRSNLNHATFEGVGRRPSEPTYFNQDQMSSSSSSSTPRLFECPRMPPLSLPQNEAGEVSFVSLSRRFNLRNMAFQPPSPPAPEAEVSGLADEIMSRSTIIHQDDKRQNASRLCSQV